MGKKLKPALWFHQRRPTKTEKGSIRQLGFRLISVENGIRIAKDYHKSYDEYAAKSNLEGLAMAHSAAKGVKVLDIFGDMHPHLRSVIQYSMPWGPVVPATQHADHQRLWPNPTVWQLAFVSIDPEFHEELEDHRDGIKHGITLKTCMVGADGIPIAANYQGPTLYLHS